METRKLLLRIKPVVVITPPENELRRKCFTLVQHKGFEWGIIGAILLNTCFMAVQMYPTYGWVDQLDYTTNYFFSMIFLVEMVLKLIAFFPKEYFGRLPNCFDFILVVASIVDMPNASAAPSIPEQLDCIWHTLRAAGVTHRDVACKNALVNDGVFTLLDFDSAVTLGDAFSQAHSDRSRPKPGVTEERWRSLSPNTLDAFKKKLLPCVPPRYLPKPKGTASVSPRHAVSGRTSPP